ncbi:tetratricopeptide repeat protein [Sphingomicrobium arenosum]|uniref:tetratricopeptide repeat protein n=1 Tax=Sphingomicrobium arenosum TaxID=2233861 RepID=UPI002240FDCB|nr:tetratricopeptide repeat protein [Sphingomicrobium arenosum]
MRNLMMLPLMMTAACAAPGVDVRMIDRGISSAELDAASRLAEAEGLMRLGNTGLAIESYRKVLRADPTMARAHAGLARAYDRMGRFDLSKRYYETALAHAPGDPAMYEAFAASKLRQGDRAGANALLAEASDRQAQRAALAAMDGLSAAMPPVSAPAPAKIAAAPMAAQVPEVVTPERRGPRLERLSGHEVLLASSGAPALPADAAPQAEAVAVARAFSREEMGARLATLTIDDERPAVVRIASRELADERAANVAAAALLSGAINGPTPDLTLAAPMAAAVPVIPMVTLAAAAPVASGAIVAPPAPVAPMPVATIVTVASAPIAAPMVPMMGASLAPVAGSIISVPPAPVLPVPMVALAALPAVASGAVVAPPAPSRAPIDISAIVAAAPPTLTAPVASARLTVIDTAMIAAVALAADESLTALAPIRTLAPPPVAPVPVRVPPIVAAPMAPPPAILPVAAPPAPIAPASMVAASVVPVAPALLSLAARASEMVAQAGIMDADVHDGSQRRARSIILYPEGEEAAAQLLAARLGYRIAAQRGPVSRITLHLGADAREALGPNG